MAIVSALDAVLLGKIETTPGVDANPAPATDAIRIISAQIKADAAPIEIDALKRTFGKIAGPVDEKQISLDVEFYVRGSGTVGAAPDWAPIAHAAGHTVTANAGTNVVINPITAPEHTATFYFYADGLLWKFVGAVCSAFSLEAPLDSFLRAKATIVAPFAAPVQAALPAGIAYQTSDPIKPRPSDVITDGGTAIEVGSFSFGAGISGEVKRYVGAARALITGRDRPKITLTKTSVGTLADWNRLLGATKASFSAQFGAAGNRVTLSAPNAAIGSLDAQADGIVMQRQLELWLDELNGDDAYQIVLD